MTFLTIQAFFLEKAEMDGAMVLGLFPSPHGALRKPALFPPSMLTFT
jgi:hypothetical protein